MNTQFVETYITYTLKDNALNVKENEVMFIPYDAQLKNPNEDIPYEHIKAVYLKKEVNTEGYQKPDSTEQTSFTYSCTIEFRHRRSVIIKNYILKGSHFVSKEFEYEEFIKSLIERLKDYPKIKIYAFEGVRAKLLKKVNQVFPTLMIGGYVVSALSIAKIIFKFFVKMTPFLGFDGDFTLAGILLFFLGATKIANYYFKKNAQLIDNDNIPLHLLPSSEIFEKQLQSKNE